MEEEKPEEEEEVKEVKAEENEEKPENDMEESDSSMDESSEDSEDDAVRVILTAPDGTTPGTITGSAKEAGKEPSGVSTKNTLEQLTPSDIGLTPEEKAAVLAEAARIRSKHQLSLTQFQERPWRRPGADISDYFNYGFNETTWTAYLEKQVQIRAELGVTEKVKMQETMQDDGAERNASTEKMVAVDRGGMPNPRLVTRMGYPPQAMMHPGMMTNPMMMGFPGGMPMPTMPSHRSHHRERESSSSSSRRRSHHRSKRSRSSSPRRHRR